jgi:hypothetical protein
MIKKMRISYIIKLDDGLETKKILIGGHTHEIT